MYDWPVSGHSARLSDLSRTNWVCPHCEKSNAANLPGRLGWMQKGH